MLPCPSRTRGRSVTTWSASRAPASPECRSRRTSRGVTKNCHLLVCSSPERLRAREHRADRDREHSGKAVPHPARVTRVRHAGGSGEEIDAFAGVRADPRGGWHRRVGLSGSDRCMRTPIPIPRAPSVAAATPDNRPTFPQVTGPSTDLSGGLPHGPTVQSNSPNLRSGGSGYSNVLRHRMVGLTGFEPGLLGSQASNRCTHDVFSA